MKPVLVRHAHRRGRTSLGIVTTVECEEPSKDNRPDATEVSGPDIIIIGLQSRALLQVDV